MLCLDNQFTKTLKNIKKIIIDFEATDKHTNGNQQLYMFDDYFSQFT